MLKEYKKKKTNFFFGFDPLKKEGCLFVKKSYNNLFITLTDFNKQVICCKTSGEILKNKLKSSKRQRKSPQTLNLIIEKLLNYFNLYNIGKIRIYWKMNYSSHLKYLINFLKTKKIVISTIFLCRILSFNIGMRGRHLRKK